MDAEEIIRDLPQALIGWYDIEPDKKVLFISGGRPEYEIIYERLLEENIRVVKAVESELHILQETYDFIIGVGIIERSAQPETLIDTLKALLNCSGILLLGTENRLAIRYFCGDRDEFTGRVLDGVDGYDRISSQRRIDIGGRAWSKAELEKIVSGAGFKKYKFYSVMPGLARPQILLADGYMPNESIDVRVFPQYKSPETIFLEEEKLYKTLMENHMFHQMANGFLIECSDHGTLSDADQITVQGDRGHKEALATLIQHGEHVIKKALYPEGRHKIEILFENTEYLARHHVPMTDAKCVGDRYVMPYMEGKIATEYFREILRKDQQKFLQELEKFREIILSSSEHVPYTDINWMQFEPWWEKRKKDDPNVDQWEKRAFGTPEEKQEIGIILQRGYIDMVSINCFYTKKGFVFFDQEFFLENFPANAILIRTIDFIYRDSPDLEQIYPREELLLHFHLARHQDTWRAMGNKFLNTLRNDRALAGYHRLYRREKQTLLANRHRMDYSQEAYEKLFTNIFKGIGSKQIYLFGSGRYARKFLEQFGDSYEIVGIIDNDKDKWGEFLMGVEIYPPSILSQIDLPYKVIICVKFFEDILAQLERMGVKEMAVYNAELDYERPLKKNCLPDRDEPKKYHVGYVAGVFDLFHIGHLNLLRRAKEQCDHLIVGVVTDEQVIKSKKTRPYILFEERLAIVQACRYVDEAVMIPVDRPNTEDAWHMYHFDAQFSGSDYENDQEWNARKVFLQQHGADMVYFPYTQTISSTEIKHQIGGNIS